MIQAARDGAHALLVAPTGGGKTLAGFLPSLIDLAERGPRPAFGAGSGVHTLYLSPLKALTTDVERNLLTPIREIGLNIHVESRTGDTKPSKRQRQRDVPPDEGTDPRQIRGRRDLRQQDRVRPRLARHREVLRDPGRVEPVDANHDLARRARLPERRDSLGDARAGKRLLGRGDGVLEVEDDDIGTERRRLRHGASIGAGHIEGGTARADRLHELS